MNAREHFVFFGHIPFLFFFISVLWCMLSVRLYAFYVVHSFKPTQILHIFLTIMATVLCTVYLGLVGGTFGLSRMLYDFQTVPGWNPIHMDIGVVPPFRDPANYTAYDLSQVRRYVKPALRMAYAAKYILVTALWVVKGALLCINWEGRALWSRGWSKLLYGMGPLLFVTYFVSLGLLWQTQAHAAGLLNPSDESLRAGAYAWGVSYIVFDRDNEIIISSFNMFTDLLLMLTAYRTVKAIKLPARAALIFFIIGTTTVAVAMIRWFILIITLGIHDVSATFWDLALWVLMELEAYLAALVVTVPGIRALSRFTNRELDLKKQIEEYEVPVSPGLGEKSWVETRESRVGSRTLSGSSGSKQSTVTCSSPASGAVKSA